MNEKIYEQMNWPDIEGIVYSESDNPHELLGGRLCKNGFLIQVFRPDAVDVSIRVEGKKKIYPMEKADEAGYFAVIIPGKKIYKYTVCYENINGKKTEYTDPYAFRPEFDETVIKKFNAGTLTDAYNYFGAHVVQKDNVSGVCFNVWAPEALRVSVVGNFNNWDGRINQMSRISNTGIFSIFIPGIKAADEFRYEIKTKDRRILLKNDPYSQSFNKSNGYCSLVPEDTDCGENGHQKTDDSLHKAGKGDSYSEVAYGNDIDRPVSVYEIDYEDMSDKESIIRQIKLASDMGFTHVEIMPLCEYCNDQSKGYETLGYYSVTRRIGGLEALEEITGMVHELKMKVIIDWNIAFMDRSAMGLYRFDGSSLYELQDTILYNHPEICAATFDYSKPQVRAFMLSAVMFWIKKYKIDGIRFGETASLLYLDYGRNPGEWCPNIYGGNHNLDAIAFLRQLKATVMKYAPDVLLFAQESSGWPQVTCDRETFKENDNVSDNTGLGFDYKWNDNWSREVISFIEKDPLYRKADYRKLTDGLLYSYNENYCLQLSHECFEDRNILDISPENGIEDKKLDAKLIYGYLYAHPGKKLVNSKQCRKFEKYIESLNALYKHYPEFYQLDNSSEGFEWVDDYSVNETVLSFIRKSGNGGIVLVILNFTPVKREKFNLGVNYQGKYKKVFESTSKKAYSDKGYGIIKTEDIQYNGALYKISADIEPLSMSVYEYVPFTDIEKQANEIIKEAKIAKNKAVKEAQKANELKLAAEKEAKEALEAQLKAQKAANDAWRAKIHAEKKARLAEEENKKIETEMKKKLEALRK